MYSTAFTGERLSKKGEGKEVLKNSYKNTPTIRVGLLLLDKGDRTVALKNRKIYAKSPI